MKDIYPIATRQAQVTHWSVPCWPMGEIIVWIGRVVVAAIVHSLIGVIIMIVIITMNTVIATASSGRTVVSSSLVIIFVNKEINVVGKTADAVPEEKDVSLLRLAAAAAARRR